MEYLEGEPLDVRLKRQGRLPVPEALQIGREIAEGLEAAHQRGLIHRDVKPGNVWLEGDRRRVKILDFGLARAVADKCRFDAAGRPCRDARLAGPRADRSGKPVDARSDLFSLGCVIYRMKTLANRRSKEASAISTFLAISTQ